MALPPYWPARKFSFDFDAALYSTILMRLRGTSARLRELVSGADPALLTHQHPLPPEKLDGQQEGLWSVQEHIGHLAVLDSGLWEQRINDYLAGTETLTAADMSNAATRAADFNSMPADAVLAQFDLARGAFLRRLEALAPQDFSRTALHPRLQTPMRLVDGLFFSAEHDDHHLAWIWEILRSQAT